MRIHPEELTKPPPPICHHLFLTPIYFASLAPPGAGLSLNNGAAAWTPGAPQAANIPSDPQPVQATNLASRNGQVFSVQPSEVSLFEPAAAAPYDRYTSQLQPLPNPETLSPADTAGWAHLLGSTSYPRSLPALGVPDALHKHFAGELDATLSVISSTTILATMSKTMRTATVRSYACSFGQACSRSHGLIQVLHFFSSCSH